MKKWFIRIAVSLVLIIVLLLTSAFVLEAVDDNSVVKYVENENLKTVRADWKGVPVDEKGRFVNHEFPFLPKASELLKWQTSANPFKQAKRNDTGRLKVLDPAEFLNGSKDGILWLGHASVYIRLGGKAILIDPVFGEPRFIRKFVEVPDPIEKIKQVDYVLITHDHRDHCDETTLRAIAGKFPNARFFGGLEMRGLFDEWKSASNTVQNAGWYQQFDSGVEDLKITFVPVRHWSRRGLFDTNRRLWGGFVIEAAGKKIYHGGDSGYGRHYKELAETFGAVDYFIIGIGAYEPRWFMQANHNNPADVVRAFQDANARTLVPMHYGTFDLSDEPPSQPLDLLKQEAAKANVADKIKILQINESFEF
jgi:L-ascorbate metabolism protein UlaG (beta-lactamase superfamily)